MMKFFILTLFISVALTTSSFGQGVLRQPNFSQLGVLQSQDLGRINVSAFDKRTEETRGSRFLSDNWAEGKLLLEDSTFIDYKLQYKFNAFENTLWLKEGDGKEYVLFNRFIKSVEIKREGQQPLVLKKIRLPSSSTAYYLVEVMYESQAIVLVKDNKRIYKKADFVDKGLSQSGSPYNRFEVSEHYYLKIGNSNFEKIKLKKSDFISAFSQKSQREALESFCEKEKISTKLTELELLKLASFAQKLTI